MRRLMVELYGKELEKRMEGTAFQKLKSMEMVHLLRNDQSENVAIWRMRLRNSSLNVEDCFKNDGVTKEVQVLERDDDGEGIDGPSYLVFLRRTTRPGLLISHSTDPAGGYLQGPMELRDGRVRFTFVGSQRQVKAVLDGAELRGMRYRVVLLTDADFAEDSLLHRLTAKQRRILIMAYKLGYFDVPKRINSDELAARFNLTGSTVVEHLAKAEHRLLAGILGEA